MRILLKYSWALQTLMVRLRSDGVVHTDLNRIDGLGVSANQAGYSTNE